MVSSPAAAGGEIKIGGAFISLIGDMVSGPNPDLPSRFYQHQIQAMGIYQQGLETLEAPPAWGGEQQTGVGGLCLVIIA
ncbi:MAG: hypothetical protein ACLQUW_10095 [Desulfobaccales bacterium]